MKYFASTHAIDQAHVRFGVDKPAVRKWLNERIPQATYITTQPDGCLVYEDSETRYIVGSKTGKETVVSCVPLQTADPIHAQIKKTVRRQLAEAERNYKREIRSIEIRKANKFAEWAQLNVNRANAKSPKVIALIEAKMAAVQTEIDAFEVDKQRAAEALETFKRAAKTYGVVAK